MATMFEWINHNRSDVETLKGPDENGSYHWDLNLPNQEQILELIAQHNSSWINPSTPVAPVTNQQLRTALVLTSFQQNKPELHPDAIKSFIEALPEPNRSLALQQWEYSNEMLRNNPLVNSMSSTLGLTSQDLDNLWNYARTL